MRWCRSLLCITAVALSACTTSETVHLARGMDRVQCGPYTAVGNVNNSQRILRDCVEDFLRQGYERTASQ